MKGRGGKKEKTVSATDSREERPIFCLLKARGGTGEKGG